MMFRLCLLYFEGDRLEYKIAVGKEIFVFPVENEDGSYSFISDERAVAWKRDYPSESLILRASKALMEERGLFRKPHVHIHTLSEMED